MSGYFEGRMNYATATPWTLLLARMFGDKCCAIDSFSDGDGIYICTVGGYRWRGATYVTSVTTRFEPHPKEGREEC